MIVEFIIVCAMIACCDIKYRLIPNRIIILGIFLGVTSNIMSINGILCSIYGMILGWSCLFIASIFCLFISRKAPLGGGDLNLLAMIGSFWGPEITLLTFAISPLLGSVWASIFNKNKIPYGVFLIIGSLIAIILKGNL